MVLSGIKTRLRLKLERKMAPHNINLHYENFQLALLDFP